MIKVCEYTMSSKSESPYIRPKYIDFLENGEIHVQTIEGSLMVNLILLKRFVAGDTGTQWRVKL